MTAVESPVSEPGPRIGALGRIFGVFFEPKETFTDIARYPRWIAPLVVLTLTGLALSISLAERVDWVAATRLQMKRVPMAARQIENLPAERQQEVIAQQAQSQKRNRYIRGAVGSLLLLVIFGGIYLGAYKLLGNIDLNYKTALAITGYAYLPMAVRELLSVPVVFLKDAADIDPENVLASNVAAFLPADAPLWQIPLGAFVDVFGLWALVLVGMGFAAVNPRKLGFGKSFGIVLGISVFITLFFAGLASLAS